MLQVPLLRDVTRLKTVHRQRVSRQGDADPAPSFSVSGRPKAVLNAAVDGWQRLLATEYESVVIAGWMTSALSRLCAPLDIIGAFGRVVEDEIRHVDICAQMVEKLGGQPTLERLSVPPFPMSIPEGSDAEFETISGMISFFCVFEHLSGLVFRDAMRAAKEDLAQWAISEIYRDEAFHGAFGFETARHYVPTWSKERRKVLAERVALDIRRFEQRLGGPLPASAAGIPPSEEVQALELLGLLSPPALLATFYVGVKDQLLPRLEEVGIEVDLQVKGP